MENPYDPQSIRGMVFTLGQKPRIRKVTNLFMTNGHAFARLFVTLYFVNFCVNELQLYNLNAQNGFPYSIFLMLPASILVVFNKEMRFSGLFIMFFALYHSWDTTQNQLRYWWAGHGFYFNELMVKRIAVTGCFM